VKVYLVRPLGNIPLAAEGEYGVAACDCPLCGVTPLRVQGTGKRPSADDRAYEADGIAVCCSQPVGLIRAEVSTLFGVREDRAVLVGRCRVY